MPWAAEEVSGEGFDDGDRGVGEDVDLGAEIFDAEFFGEERRGKKKYGRKDVKKKAKRDSLRTNCPEEKRSSHCSG
jgi:hypothetical protein